MPPVCTTLTMYLQDQCGPRRISAHHHTPQGFQCSFHPPLLSNSAHLPRTMLMLAVSRAWGRLADFQSYDPPYPVTSGQSHSVPFPVPKTRDPALPWTRGSWETNGVHMSPLPPSFVHLLIIQACGELPGSTLNSIEKYK